ncbi:MAG TPA: DNA mismatch repair endonuclease MutL, partial [Candidatus Limnocylindria bacterium]|nr:DNA mismatch repair endonuclease MutL [Candidatus Limnocylindria bacterium]
MPGKIRVLPGDVVALIAAGEVVQRPAAALKELVENSLDAGATSVSVAVENGGLDSIRVTDNGGGIAPEDMRLAFAPHATSKLGRAEDLRSVASLGFRGEALASISRVSRVTLTSRQPGQDEGVKAVNEGGDMVSVGPAACAQGTQVLVRDLFHNAPVRRDFLQNPRREAASCAEVMASFILGNPGVAFRYSQDGKQVYASAGDGRLAGAALAVYGLDALEALRPVDGGGQGVLVQGLVGIGEQARASRAHQHFFINGRAVRSMTLSAALEEACRTRVMIGRHPMCALHLRLPFEAVDVNVHPNKWEVRFRNEAAVSDAVLDAVRDAVSGAPLDNAPPLFPREERTAPAQVVRMEPNEDASSALAFAEWAREAPRTALSARDAALDTPAHPVTPARAPAREEPQAVQEHSPFVPAPEDALAVIGKAFGTYIIAQRGERLLLI